MEVLLRDGLMAADDGISILPFHELIIPHVLDPSFHRAILLPADRTNDVLACADGRIRLSQDQTLDGDGRRYKTMADIVDGWMQQAVSIDVMRNDSGQG